MCEELCPFLPREETTGHPAPLVQASYSNKERRFEGDLPVVRIRGNNYGGKSSPVGVVQGRGCGMQQVSEVPSEHFVACSKAIVLECRCGEKLILLGPEEDWRKEEHTVFTCSGCGGTLFLEDIH